jgi:hypothetical protein
MSLLSSNKTNKPILRDRLRKFSEGVTAHLSSETSIKLAGVTFTPSDLVKLLQSLVSALDAADAQKAKLHEAVTAVEDQSAKARPVLAALEKFVGSQFPSDSSVLADFGIAPPKVPVVKVATKASAVEKAAATRKSRGTMGSRQRKAKGKVPVTAPAATKPPA